MANLTIKQLRYFEAVAIHGHFGHAAEVCAISQPAISVQIKELEQTLGAVLFERGGRHVRLTAFGEVIAQRTREILQSVDDLTDISRATQEQPVGRLRVGIIPTIAPYILPKIIAGLALTYPDLDIHIRETLTDTLINELSAGRLDTAIVALPVSEPSLMETPLFDENFVLVRSRDDADLPVPDRTTLHEMRLLLLEEGHCFRDQALSFCGIRTPLPREGMDGSSLSTLVQMVGAGIGVTLIPQMAVPIETRSADVAIAHFKHPAPSRSIGMIWRKTSPLTKQLTQVSHVVRNAAGA
jgi:LysR family hydrogen peroxide-inducible transcriptional activator